MIAEFQIDLWARTPGFDLARKLLISVKALELPLGNKVQS
jgi:hypothetical protein